MPPLKTITHPKLTTITKNFQFIHQKPKLKKIFTINTITIIFNIPNTLFPTFTKKFNNKTTTLNFLYTAPYTNTLLTTLFSK